MTALGELKRSAHKIRKWRKKFKRGGEGRTVNVRVTIWRADPWEIKRRGRMAKGKRANYIAVACLRGGTSRVKPRPRCIEVSGKTPTEAMRRVLTKFAARKVR